MSPTPSSCTNPLLLRELAIRKLISQGEKSLELAKLQLKALRAQADGLEKLRHTAEAKAILSQKESAKAERRKRLVEANLARQIAKMTPEQLAVLRMALTHL